MLDILRKLDLDSQIEVINEKCNANKKYILDSSGKSFKCLIQLEQQLNFLKMLNVSIEN